MYSHTMKRYRYMGKDWRLVRCALQRVVLTVCLTLALIAAGEVCHTLYVNGSRLNAYGGGFVAGNSLLFVLASSVCYALANKMQKEAQQEDHKRS